MRMLHILSQRITSVDDLRKQVAPIPERRSLICSCVLPVRKRVAWRFAAFIPHLSPLDHCPFSLPSRCGHMGRRGRTSCGRRRCRCVSLRIYELSFLPRVIAIRSAQDVHPISVATNERAGVAAVTIDRAQEPMTAAV